MEFSNREEYREKFILASSDVQDLMSSMDTLKIITEASKKYGVKENNVRDLSYLVGEVMLDMIDLEKFKKELIVRLEISEDNAESITTVIQKKLFSKIKSGGVGKESVKDRGVVGAFKGSAPQAKSLLTQTWFVSRERQDVANQLREKLDKTERLIMLVRNFSGSANDQQPQAPN